MSAESTDPASQAGHSGAMEVSPGPSEPIHPGEHLAEILHDLGITQYRLAKTIGVPPIRVHDLIDCHRSFTVDSALRIGRALGTTPEYWLNLQRMYDLEVARNKTDTSAIKPLVQASG